MKRLKSLTNRSGLFGVILAFFATSIGVTSCRPDFDLDKRMPEWLGTSIYETLDEGFKNDSTGEEYSFKTFVRLIDDLDQKEILAKTGSKTLFVASDKAFDEFFKNCPFTDANGNKITSYDQLSKAQKSMILNGSMLNNVYQVAMLSSSPGGEQSPPILGNCMRRVSASQVLDTIPVVNWQNFPKNNPYWDRLRDKKNNIVLLQDGTNKPIIFFVNKFLQSNKIDNDDYDFLFRLGKYSKVGKPAHKPGDASVNGVSIDWPNKKCFNGFLHVMSQVIYLLPNMADYIATDPNSQIYSSILERFSVPYYESSARVDRDENVRMLINSGLVKNPALEQAMNANSDTVFVKKYLAKRARLQSQNVSAEQNTNMDKMDPTTSLLKFDPGWNSFISSTIGNNTDVALQQDMGLMFVPEDDALMEWWLDESQVGARLRARYGLKKDMPAASMTKQDVIDDMAGIPMSVIVELINNNMQPSLVGSVPHTSTATDACSAIHSLIGVLLRNQNGVSILSLTCADGGVATSLDNLVESSTIHHTVLDDGECSRTPRLDSNHIAIVETTHVELASSSAALGLSVGRTIDIERAHTADSLAAVVVEHERLLALIDEFLVHDVEHLKEGSVVGDVLHLA